MLWPSIMVWVKLGLVPRMETRSFSSNAPSFALAALMFTPGTRASESATFLSGILPMSSEVITSTRVSSPRLLSSDASMAPRMPLTTTVSRSVASCCDAGVAWAGVAASCAAAVPTTLSAATILSERTVFLSCMVIPSHGR